MIKIMEIVKMNMVSKGKVGERNYFYCPIIRVDNEYYFAQIIKSPVLLDKDVIKTQLVAKQKIAPEFYAANGLS